MPPPPLHLIHHPVSLVLPRVHDLFTQLHRSPLTLSPPLRLHLIRQVAGAGRAPCAVTAQSAHATLHPDWAGRAVPALCGLGPNNDPGLCGGFYFLFLFIELEISGK
jgi:hypothetical protein